MALFLGRSALRRTDVLRRLLREGVTAAAECSQPGCCCCVPRSAARPEDSPCGFSSAQITTNSTLTSPISPARGIQATYFSTEAAKESHSKPSDSEVWAFLHNRISSAVQLQTSCILPSPQNENSRAKPPGDIKRKIMDVALGHVAKHGWSDAALWEAANQLGLSPAVVGMLERGPVELVEHHVLCQNAAFSAKFNDLAKDLEGESTSRRIFEALKMRLQMNAAHIDSWPQALAMMGQPQNSPRALEILALLMDEIWYLVGDRSVDSSWYTKRAALAGVYVATDLYMLTDTSPGFQDTWEALERRLADVHAAGALFGEAIKAAETAARSAGVSPYGTVEATGRPQKEGGGSADSPVDDRRQR